MPILDELRERIRAFARGLWGDIPNATSIPSTDDLTYDNSGKRLDATVLYADIDGSTDMVDALADWHAAEYYKAYLHCASQIIKRNGGEIQAYDGDRVMAIYTGDNQADNAVGTALELNFAVRDIINPEFAALYGVTHRPLGHTVGIDSGQMLVIKVGVRALGELAWIGGAANYAAKLTSFDGLDHNYQTRVTEGTYVKLTRGSLYSSGTTMWEGPYIDLKKRRHYRSNWSRTLA
jgi:class 3 adenylate cyclase